VNDLRYTLLSDGPSDRGLLHILDWLLQQHLPNRPIQAEWADLRRMPRPPRQLAERINMAIELYPCDVLFIHRDAERESRENRAKEIARARRNSQHGRFPIICVIPVRMTEAWLLISEVAIRHAAGNPNGLVPLELPRTRDLELLPDPKRVLNELVRAASGLKGRRLKKLRVPQCAARVPEYVDDFSALRQLPAFAALERDVTCRFSA